MKLKQIFLVVCVCLLAINAQAAEGDILYKRNFGGSGNDIYISVTTVEDGVVALSPSRMVKHSHNGDVMWEKNTSGYIPSAITTVSDDIVVVGSGNDGNAVIEKYDNSGILIWSKSFGGSANDDYNSVIAVSDGIIAVGGSEQGSFGNGDWTGIEGKGGTGEYWIQYDADAIIVKYDNDGNVLWKKNFGGPDGDIYNSVTAVSDGVVAAGYSYGNSFFDYRGDWAGINGRGGGYGDAIVVKYDNDGNVVWKNHFGISGTYGPDLFRSVITVADGIVAVGEGGSGVFGSYNYAPIVKYDNNGNAVWETWENGSFDNTSFYSATAVFDGIIAVGYANEKVFFNANWEGISAKGRRDAIVIKYNNNGNVVWRKNFGGWGDDIFRAVTTGFGSIVAVGSSAEDSFDNGDWMPANSDWIGVEGKGGTDAIVVKYALAEVAEVVSATVISNNSNLGSATGSGLYIQNTTTQIQAIPLSDNIFVSWNDGSIEKLRNITVTRDTIFTANFISREDLAELFWQQNDCENANNTINSLQNDLSACASEKDNLQDLLDACTTTTDENTISVQSASLSIYPNPVPTNGILNIESEILKAGDKIEIFDMQGKLISVNFATGAESYINIGNLVCGVYLLRLAGKSGVKFEVK